MNNSVVVFFFTSSNHLSNVKTLQSIYRQDYRHIRLIVCNDCTSGFESERLLNNFEHDRPENIEYIVFQENERHIGEFRSQAQFWSRLTDAFFFTIHSGEYFTSPSALRSCVQKLKENGSVCAVACNCSCWDSSFRALQEEYTAAAFLAGVGNATGGIRDCMVLYRVSALRDIPLQLDETCTHISQQVVPYLLEQGKRIAVLEKSICRFSDESLDPMLAPIPTEFGRHTLENIERLLRERTQDQPTPETALFQAQPNIPQKKSKRNLFLMLSKLSTVSRILLYAVAALLLFTAGALFLNLHTGLFTVMGIGFLVLAVLAAVFTVGMLGCNLYLKKNPQRLVQ